MTKVKSLLLGTFNAHKVREISPFVPKDVIILTCDTFKGLTVIKETGSTLEENAILKAEGYSKATGMPCFADDTGLFVEALNGLPGIDSAYYGGEQGNATKNIARLLNELQTITYRKAYFRTVIAYATPNAPTRCFEGVLQGEILTEPQGQAGFGYDPIFKPDGFNCSLATLTLQQKNQISHRAKATISFFEFLNQLL